MACPQLVPRLVQMEVVPPARMNHSAHRYKPKCHQCHPNAKEQNSEKTTPPALIHAMGDNGMTMGRDRNRSIFKQPTTIHQKPLPCCRVATGQISHSLLVPILMVQFERYSDSPSRLQTLLLAHALNEPTE
jgi:hypothetical protein